MRLPAPPPLATKTAERARMHGHFGCGMAPMGRVSAFSESDRLRSSWGSSRAVARAAPSGRPGRRRGTANSTLPRGGTAMGAPPSSALTESARGSPVCRRRGAPDAVGHVVVVIVDVASAVWAGALCAAWDSRRGRQLGDQGCPAKASQRSGRLPRTAVATGPRVTACGLEVSWECAEDGVRRVQLDNPRRQSGRQCRGRGAVVRGIRSGRSKQADLATEVAARVRQPSARAWYCGKRSAHLATREGEARQQRARTCTKWPLKTKQRLERSHFG